MTRETLLERFDALAETCGTLFGLCPLGKLDWRPAPGARSLHEICDHLAAVPLVDLAVLQGNPRQVAAAVEEALHGAGPDDWTEVFTRGARAVHEYFAGLTERDWLEKRTRAHYGTARPQCAWLLELLAHVVHHRGQLHLYLKMLGVPAGPEVLYT